ncbi:MAG: AAA family ATPase [Blastocatellia bacterium]
MKRNLTFILLTTGTDTERALQTALATQRSLRVVASSDNPQTVYAETIRWQPAAVILTLSSDPRATWELSRRIHTASPDTLIICAAQNPTPEMILESLRAGGCEFLRLPIIADEFKTVLERVELFSAGKAQTAKQPGRVIAVNSGKGGSGTSFLAANLAALLEASTVLVDLNLRAGDLDVFFGIKPKYSVYDLVMNRSRLDEALLNSYLTPVSARLSLLSAPRELVAAEDLRASHLVEALQVLREHFDYVVLDLPHALDSSTVAMLDQADDILLLFTPDILSARGAQRALSLFNQLGYPRQKVHLVVNRWSKKANLPLEQVEEFLGARIACQISNDYPQVIDSVNQGQPLSKASLDSALAADLRQLATMLRLPFKALANKQRQPMLASFLRRPPRTTGIKEPPLPNKV